MKYLWLLLCLTIQAMEEQQVTKTTVLMRMREVRNNGDSPLPWNNIRELKSVRKEALAYCDKHQSYASTLPFLIKAAQETREDREKREAKLAVFSKAKIAVGSAFCLFSVGQIVTLITSWAEDDCDAAYDRVFNAMGALSSGLGGAYMVYDGMTNSDAKLESLEACKTELLLLEKYVALQQQPESGYTTQDSKTEG